MKDWLLSRKLAHANYCTILSSLEISNLQDLDIQMNNNPKLKELLTTPGDKLPEKYLYLLAEVLPNLSDYTLYDLIKLSMSYKNTYSYFSKAGDVIVGWVAYQTSFDVVSMKDKVVEIKMFSFDITRPNPVLIKDLEELLNDLLNKFDSVSWVAVKENTANKIYNMALARCSEKGFKTSVSTDNMDNYVYKIEKF